LRSLDNSPDYRYCHDSKKLAREHQEFQVEYTVRIYSKKYSREYTGDNDSSQAGDAATSKEETSTNAAKVKVEVGVSNLPTIQWIAQLTMAGSGGRRRGYPHLPWRYANHQLTDQLHPATEEQEAEPPRRRRQRPTQTKTIPC
jgi:hypothetical protein